MNSNPRTSARRLAVLLGCSLAVAWSATGCGNSGGIGDGVIDDGIPPGGAMHSSAGTSNSRAGSTSSNGGVVGQGGNTAAGGKAGSGGGASGSTGVGGGNGGNGVGGGTGGTGTAGAATGVSGGPAQGGMPGASGMGAGGAGKGGGGAGGGPSLTCGDFKIDAGEQCDDGLGLPAGGMSAGGGAGIGGNAGTAGATVHADYGQLCSNSCTKISNQACLDCEKEDICGDYVNNCLGPDGTFSAAEQSRCFAVMACIQKSNCFDGTGTLGTCYCGALDTASCGAAPFTGAGSPNGACVAEIKAGFPTLTSNQDVLGSQFAVEFPSGAAMKRLNCQKITMFTPQTSSTSKTCAVDCGFTTGGAAFP